MTDYEPSASDLVWTDFDPHLGREQSGRRPALVLSPVDFWRATRFVFVAPITSRVRPFPSSIVLPPSISISGEVLLGQTRSIDTVARRIVFTGEAIGSNLLAQARAKLAVLMGV